MAILLAALCCRNWVKLSAESVACKLTLFLMSRSNQSARGKTFLLADLKRRKPNKQMKKQTQTRKSIQKNAEESLP